MKKDEYYIIGVMSGTSLDGIDLCYVKFHISNGYRFSILKAITYPYPKVWVKKLQAAFEEKLENLTKIDKEYTDYLAGQISRFTDEFNIGKIDFIASHGHTIFHKPEKGITVQIGNRPKLADKIALPVVCDFRVQDVKLGGQGAPLVPIGDRLLFSEYDYCINLGGFANISYESEGSRIAYDICPVNIVMNAITQKIGMPYDNKGQLAMRGEVDNNLLNELNKLPFYQLPAPKSLGFEWVTETVFPILNSYKLSEKNLLATFAEHISVQISECISPKSKVLITGGGAFNDYLISRIQSRSDSEIIIPNKDIINFKEALVFALLGLLRWQNKTNVLASVTGAKHDHSSGEIFQT
ncbi:MAG: anhydro-N-acetylmuramic acid kinase [Flavobacteriales bacterium]|nr:MAG: anhydro-N-acetylmuramic acid kinase [Flavobacteriales bacterium]